MSDIKIHSFNAMIAEEIGIEGAIIFGDLYFWCTQNKLNERNLNKCKDGKERNFTFNSVSALQKQYNYMSCSMIYKTLKTLEAKGYIIADNFNEHLYDRTKWYAVTEKGEVFYEKYSGKHKNPLYTDKEKKEVIEQEKKAAIFQNKDSIFQNEETILTEKEPIPDTNTNSNSDTNSSEDSSLHSESSCEESNDTDEKETQTDTLITKNKMSEQSDKADRPEEKEIDMNSDSQTPPDGPAPWEKPAKKSKPKVPLPDREPVNDIEKVFKEYMRMFDSAKQEGLVSGNYCWGAANYGARVKTVKFWLKEHSADEIKQALWLAKKDNFCLKTLGLSFMPILSQKVFPRLLEGRVQTLNSSFHQKHREAFIDGERDYSNTDDW